MSAPRSSISKLGRNLLAAIAIVIASIMLAASLPAQEPADDPSARAIELFNNGQDAHESGDLSKAIELYKGALAAVAEFPEAEFQLGSAYLSLGKPKEAEASFRRALELREDWGLALAALGSLLVQNGSFAEADALLGKAVELDELNFPAYSALANLRVRSKASAADLRALLEKLTLLTSKASPTAAIWVARASVENALGETAAARASIARALAIDARDADALTEAAAIALKENDPDRAESFVRRLETSSPASPNIRMLKARIAIARNKTDEALVILRSITPATTESNELIEKISLATTADVAQLESTLATKPEDPVVLGRLCDVYRLRDAAKALDYCRRASAVEPDNIAHAVGFGAALIQARQYEAAIDLFQRLRQFAPENSTVRTNLATAYFQAKLYAQAKAELRWLLDKQPDLTAAYYFIAVAHDHLGEYMDAMANYQEYLRRADATKNKDEIDRVTLRLPTLEKQIRSGQGRKNE